MQNWKSLFSLFVCWAALFAALFFYYPKWNKGFTEATISWDVSGYYYYLPATLIYQDLQHLSFKDQIQLQYRPTGDFQQGYQLPNGNFVLKYSCGQAILYAPFFFVAHAYTSWSGQYPADGFSLPYQFMIAFGSLLVAFLGLFVLRRVLLRYFSDQSTAITLLLLILGSNYLEYASITGAMTHNYLFTLYALLLASTVRFYEKPTYWSALGIGAIIGLAALVRPTEIMTALIPILWGIRPDLRTSIAEKLLFFKSNLPKLALAVATCILIGSLQLIYWKSVSGDWLVYSYGDEQGFDWFSPHIWEGLMSYKSGWLMYSPMMVFSLIGLRHLYKQQKTTFLTPLIYSVLFIYVTFAWNIWWYGGSLGQRAMVQVYPVLALPMAAFIEAALQTRFWKYGFALLSLLFVYLNLWWTHQAHLGGLFMVEEMNGAYYWNVVGRLKARDEETLKLLDTNEAGFAGLREHVRELFSEDFEKDSTQTLCELPAIQGQRSACLDANRQQLPLYTAPLKNGEAEWVRASGVFRCRNKEWNIWLSAQLQLVFLNGADTVKTKKIRLYRYLNDGDTKGLFLDIKPPKAAFDRIGASVGNGGGTFPLAVDQLKIEAFDAQ